MSVGLPQVTEVICVFSDTAETLDLDHCGYCGRRLDHDDQQCPALDQGRCGP